MSSEIIPSILVDSQKEFERRLRLVENLVQTVSVDILDGSIYSVTNWFDARAVGALNTPVNFELHLMVSNPLPIIASWCSLVPKTIRAIIHAELGGRPLLAVIQQIQEVYHLQAGLALNPETPLTEVHHVLQKVDELLFLGVHPGSSGQPFEGNSILEKIRQAHVHVPTIPLGIDGGVKKENILDLQKAGVSRFYVTSAIFEQKDPASALRELQKQVGML